MSLEQIHKNKEKLLIFLLFFLAEGKQAALEACQKKK